ncbi:MAG TPA: oligosaccharide flippase family protein [Solirubrobacteraceae bacterium]|jgi:O-antigen/teichoic acid export membrane protein
MSEIDGIVAPATPGADPYAAGEAGGRVIRGGSLRVAGALAGVLAGVVSAPLVVRHLGVVDYGRYLTVTSVIFIITALSEGGLANVAVRLFSVSDAAQRRSLISNLTGLRLALGSLGALTAVGFGLIAGYERILILGLVLGSAGYILSAVQGSYSVVLSGTLRLSALAGIDLLRSLATTCLLVALVIAGSGLSGFYLVAVAVQGLALIVTGVLVRREVPLRPAFHRARWHGLLHETATYALAATLGAIYFQVALIAMSLLDPGSQTGYYAIAFRIVEIVNGIPWLLAGSVLPVLAVAAANDPTRLRYVAGRVFEGAMIAGGWVMIIIEIGAGFGIDIIAGAKGQPSIGVLRIMGLGVTATFLVSSWGFVLLSLRLYRQLVLANLGALALAILLSAILIPTLHARGGAITTAILELTLAGSYTALLYRRGVVPPLRFILRFALAIGLGLGVGAILLTVHAILGVFAGSVVYFGVLWITQAIPPELIDALPWQR